MNLDNLTKTTGEWLRGVGPSSDVVISSRVRLARNLANRPFLSTAGQTDRTEVYRQITDEIAALNYDCGGLLIDLDLVDELDRHLLVERHLISRQHAAGEGSRGVTISGDETKALMVNEEDHLRIQSLRSGLQLEDAWQEVNEIDDQLGKKLKFAFDRELGFLTVCPTNIGTGIRVSVMLHLPALKLTKEIERVARAARDMRLAVRGLHGEGTEAIGDLYQLSNQVTLGKSEEEIIRDFNEQVIPQIVNYERAARESLANHRSVQLDDKIWRAYGILRNARTVSSEEVLTLLSPIRLGVHMKRFHELDLGALNELFLFTQSAHLQKICGRDLDENERGEVRAEYIRKRLGN